MAARGESAAAARPASPRFDPLRDIWRLVTNVKFALFQVGLIGLACLVGVLIPQLPGEMRDNPAARAAWVAAQREDFGILTTPMERMLLFEVFRSWWFNGLWFLVLFSMTVCTVSRFRPVARNVHRPPRRVPDQYFESAHHRVTAHAAAGPGDVEAALRRRRFHVERAEQRDGATYLFADRFPWTQYGTFISHLALLLFLVGGVLTRFAGFDRTLIAAETAAPAPVFGEARADQIFVGMDDAVRGIDDDGNIVDFRSHLTVTQGDEVVQCTTTVNDPCRAFGHSIHQAAFIDDLARLRVVGPDGLVLFDDLVDFQEEKVVVPHVRVIGPGGDVRFDQAVPQMASEATDAGTVGVAEVRYRPAPGDERVRIAGLAWTRVEDDLVITVGGPGLALTDLRPGERVIDDEGYTIEYVGAAAIPAITFTDFPDGGDGTATVQMPVGRNGREYLWISGLGGEGVAIEPGETYTSAAGYAYTFGGRAEGSGLSVKRDPGDTFIWVAVGLATVGLGITFYVPRRRLWARVAPGEIALAGLADRFSRFDRELRQIGAELGDPDLARAVEAERAED